MSAKKRGLGKGFEAIIPGDMISDIFDPTAHEDHRVSDLRKIDIADIFPDKHQPRRHFDESTLAELAASIKEHGVLQPLVVVPRTNGGYTIVAGERRFRASKLAGLTTMPALVRTLSDQHKLEISLIENVQRQDLNPLETATAYAKLRDQFNLSLEEIGARVGGKSSSAVSNVIRLLKLSDSVKKALAEGKITEGQARPLINVQEDVANALLTKIIAEQWSARHIEAEAARLNGSKKASQILAVKKASAAYQHKAEELGKKFGTKAAIKTLARGNGTITIKFANKKDLERILGEII